MSIGICDRLSVRYGEACKGLGFRLMAQMFGRRREALGSAALGIAGHLQYANPEEILPAAPVACVLPRTVVFHSREIPSRGSRRAGTLPCLVGIACAQTLPPEGCSSWQVEWLARLADRL